MAGLVPSRPGDRGTSTGIIRDSLAVRGTAIAAVLMATATWAGPLWAEQLDAPAAAQPVGQATPGIVARSVKPEERAGPGVDAYGLTREDYRRIVAGIPVLRQAIPVRELTQGARYHDRQADVLLVGTTPEYRHAHAIRIERGRFLTDKDLKTAENVAVIGHGVAQSVFPGEDPIGKSLGIGSNYFLVVGKTSKAPARLPWDDRRRDPDREIYVPLSTMRSRMGDLTIIAKSGSFDLERFELSRIEITLDDPAKVDEVAEAIRRLLRPFHEQPDYSVEVVR